MRKGFGARAWMYPLLVLIIGTYDEGECCKGVYY